MSSEGKEKSTSCADTARNWLRQSERFLEVAKMSKDIPEASLNSSQLAAEQALKACIYSTFFMPDIEQIKELKKHFQTHNHLDLLARLPPEVITPELHRACNLLNEKLDRPRYPTPFWGKPPYDSFSKAEAQDGIEAAELVYRFAFHYVKEISEAVSRCAPKAAVPEQK